MNSWQNSSNNAFDYIWNSFLAQAPFSFLCFSRLLFSLWDWKTNIMIPLVKGNCLQIYAQLLSMQPRSGGSQTQVGHQEKIASLLSAPLTCWLPCHLKEYFSKSRLRGGQANLEMWKIRKERLWKWVLKSRTQELLGFIPHFWAAKFFSRRQKLFLWYESEDSVCSHLLWKTVLISQCASWNILQPCSPVFLAH